MSDEAGAGASVEDITARIENAIQEQDEQRIQAPPTETDPDRISRARLRRMTPASEARIPPGPTPPVAPSLTAPTEPETPETPKRKPLPLPDTVKKSAADFIRERQERKAARDAERAQAGGVEAKQRELEERLTAIQDRDRRVAELRSQGKYDDALKLAGLGESVAELQREVLRNRGLLQQSQDPRVDSLVAELEQYRAEKREREEREEAEREERELNQLYEQELSAVAANLKELGDYEAAAEMSESPALVQFAHQMLANGQATNVEQAAGLAYAAYRPLADQLLKVFYPHLAGKVNPDQDREKPVNLPARDSDQPETSRAQLRRGRAPTNLAQSRSAEASQARPRENHRDWISRVTRDMQSASLNGRGR